MQQEWINYTNNALVLHYLLCFQTPSGLRVQVQRNVGLWCWGWRNFPPSPAGNTPFAILDYIGPPFCNASDSNISQWICMSTQCRSQSVKPRYLNISLFLRCPDCFGRSLGYTGFFVQQQLLTSTPEDLYGKATAHVCWSKSWLLNLIVPPIRQNKAFWDNACQTRDVHTISLSCGELPFF